MNLLGLMAGLGMAFNSGEHAERTHSRVLPAGWYPVQIVNSEIKPTKTVGGARLNLQFKIIGGEFVGQVLFGGYNVKNANPVAVQIAMEELAELSRAVRTPVWNDTQELHMKPFNIKVKVKPGNDGYEPSNEPQIYQDIDNMEGVTYATKADAVNLPKAKPANAAQSGAFGQQAPTGGGAPQGFGQPAQQPVQQGFQPQQPVQQQVQQQTQGFQPQQQVQQQPVNQFQQQPVQPQQQPVQQQPVQQVMQAGNTNFSTAAQNQPWSQPQQQPVQQEQQPAQQFVQQQPVQQQQVQEQVQQQPVQQQQPVEQPVQQQGGQPNWAQQQVQPGTEQPVQQQQQMQQPEVQDDIAQAAQTKTPPWKKPVQEEGAAQ